MAGEKGTKKAAAGDAPKTKGKRKDEGKEEVERPKKAPKAEKAAAAPKSRAKKTDEAKPKKEKAKKDPNAPKKGLTAFMFFSNANRDKVKQENPGVSFGEVGKLLGERWKALTADEKAEYDEMAKKDKERYAKEMEAYKPGEGAPAAKAKAKPAAKAKAAPAKKKEEEEEEEEEEGDEGGSEGGDEEEEEEEDDE